MTETNEASDQASAPAVCQTYDANDPIQQEISQILKEFQYDIMGVISLGKDGIMRSLTFDCKVLSAKPFSTLIPCPISSRAPQD
jgi:hypothetical protein